MTVFVVGSTGQLARHLHDLRPDAIYCSRADADLSQPQAVERFVRDAHPSFIVNAAAYTAVDRAESEPDVAWRVNAEAPAAMARAAAALAIPLIHVSTDYVFDGLAERPYLVTDSVGPLSVYGATKLAGELAVRAICPQHYILRTSWVFSQYGANFVKTMLRLGKERDTLQVVNDQVGRPTYAGDLARLITALVSSDAARPALPFGTYHAGGGRALSWCEFAATIFRRAQAIGMIQRVPAVQAITTSEYRTPARRPVRSILEPSPILEQQTGVRFDWEAGLHQALARLSE